jgi:hypothetical protein
MKIVIVFLGVIFLGFIVFYVYQNGMSGNKGNNSINPPQEIKDTMNNNSSSKAPQSDERINVRIGDSEYTVTLFDNPTAKDLLSQLPLSLTISDFGGQEKVATPPRALTMDGVAKGDNPEINDLGYYAPSNTIVFYYDDVGYFDGIVRLGQFNSSLESIRNLPDGTTVTLERDN